MRLATQAVLAVSLAVAAASGSAAGQVSRARRWSVIVLVPERHIDRPNIPDPAVETAICRALIAAGYKVMDDDRVRQLRYSRQMETVVQGGPDASREARAIGRRFGADLLIAGEAFTQVVTRRRAETDIGAVDRIQCRARVELKAVRVDTGEKPWADAVHQTGPPEATVELSSKAALTSAADEIAASLIRGIASLALSDARWVEVEVRNIGGAAVVRDFELALAKLPGVMEVATGSFDNRTYTTEVRVDTRRLGGLAATLEAAPQMRRFRMQAQSSGSSRIVLRCK
ncbi:MAG: hypothetical protein NT029_07075 [Armatimonadetes bacterium]|nr:hypothetical protein [Armatimonadota bacterium]